jgi:polyferredoxin
MSRLKKPAGLIRYDAQSRVQGLPGSDQKPWLQPRVWMYAVLIAAFGMGLSYTLITRKPLEITLIRAVDAPYQEIQTALGIPQVINHFKIDLRNQTFYSQKITFSIPNSKSDPTFELIVANQTPQLEAGESDRLDIFLKFPKNILTFGKAKLILEVESQSQHLSPIHQTQEVNLVGPLH